MAAQTPAGINLQADRSGILIRATMVCAVLSGIAVAGRLVSRKMLKSKITLSDYLVIIGLLCSWVISGLGVWEAKLGLGKHIQIVPQQHYSMMLKIIFADEILYSIVLTVIKTSILILYHGLFPGKTFARLLVVIGAFCIAWGVSVLFVAIFSCTPIHGFWDLLTMKPPPKCINNKAFYIGLSVPNILADIVILCLPVTKVWKLQMSRRSKIAVSGMFLLGGVVIICSTIRLFFLLTVDNLDFTWSFYTIVVWSAAEVNLAVISACMPTMRPVLQKILPSSAFSAILGMSKSKGSKSDVMPWNNTSRNVHGEEFQRLHDYPFDGTRSMTPAIYHPEDERARNTKDVGHALKPLPQIHVSKDI